MFRRFLVLAAAVLVLAPTASAAGLTRSEASILREMNRVRAAHGLGSLRADSRLETAARAHNREMIRTGAFAHGALASRMLQFKVQGSFAGENLAWGVGDRGTARGIVAAWLASPDHRANLLRPSFRRVGVGALVGSFRGFARANVVTADFAG
jgi:uncharacterized protein YkwD